MRIGAIIAASLLHVACGRDPVVRDSSTVPPEPPRLPSSPLKTFALAISTGGSGRGTVTAAPEIECPVHCLGHYEEGSTVTLTATAAAGSRFAGWRGECSGIDPCTVTIRSDLSLSATFEALAADDDCAGLGFAVPDAPSSITIAAGSDFSTCSPGMADGAGNLALAYTGSGKTPAGHITFLGADGRVRGAHELDGLRALSGQRSGFVAVGERDASTFVAAFASDGAQIGGAAGPGAGPAAADPNGGIVVASSAAIEAYDATGARRWNVSISDVGVRLAVLGIDSRGNALLVFDGSTRFTMGPVKGLWVDRDGHRGEVFAFKKNYVDTWLRLYPRSGGGFFVQERSPLGGSFIGQIESLATQESSPPEWLVRRGGWRVQPVRGGAAYVLVPDSGGVSCTLEVVSAKGTTCSSMLLTDLSGMCSDDDLVVGIDGTLVQTAGSSSRFTCHENCACTWRWWTGHFR